MQKLGILYYEGEEVVNANKIIRGTSNKERSVDAWTIGSRVRAYDQDKKGNKR